MSSSWDDFEGSKKDERPKDRIQGIVERNEPQEDDRTGCDWGLRSGHGTGDDIGEIAVESSSLSKFIEIYEAYLEDRHSINSQTKNHSSYEGNPQKALQEWFDNEGQELLIKTEQPRANQYTSSLDLPVEDQDFTITSECHSRKQEAIDEVCLTACRMLDECGLLCSWQSGTVPLKEDLDRKRRLDKANKEDDIELDQTCTKRHCDSVKSVSAKLPSKVNTYESLLAKWNELNFSILKLKAELVKLDLSVAEQTDKQKKDRTTVKSPGIITDVVDEHKTNTGDTNGEDDEIDPLDEYMLSLETKIKPSRDEKIKKSRIKSQIVAYEREQAEVSRFIELAKPKFDLNKACPPTSTTTRGNSIDPKGSRGQP